MRVLIADDDDIVLVMLEDALTGAGYDVRVARNGREALEIIREGECRLVISDWEMPEMTGVELCRKIRAEDLPGYVYMILLTSRDSVKEAPVEGLAAGADDFVSKPFEPSELLARVGTGKRVLSLETRDVAIFAMAKLAESRDADTGMHLERVRSYARILAQHLASTGKHPEITAEYIHLIYLTSPLHDIGKVGVPDSVLLKPGRLSDREFEIMKTHTTLGAQTLDAALRQFPGVRFLQMGRDIAATHHERFDGTGYPAGLAGEQIPLCGRIVALADVYDALNSKRVYKPAFSHDIARAMIVAETGTHFDPAVVDAFIANEARFAAIRERYNDSAIAAA